MYLRWLVSGARQRGFLPIPSRFELSAFSCRVTFAVAAVLSACAVIAGVLALVNGDLPGGLASTYLGAGINYGVIAIIGSVIIARRLSAAGRRDAPRSS